MELKNIVNIVFMQPPGLPYNFTCFEKCTVRSIALPEMHGAIVARIEREIIEQSRFTRIAF